MAVKIDRELLGDVANNAYALNNASQEFSEKVAASIKSLTNPENISGDAYEAQLADIWAKVSTDTASLVKMMDVHYQLVKAVAEQVGITIDTQMKTLEETRDQIIASTKKAKVMTSK